MPGLKVGDLYAEVGLERQPFNTGMDKAHADFTSFGSKLLGKATALGAGLGLVMGGTELVKKIGEIGISFQDMGNTFAAVTGASSTQMAQMSQRAIDLGNDLTLPATSATDAEAAMVELAKGGLSVADSMDAAKGVLQLSTAATIDTGQAATFTADALNTFHLKGKDAVMVADLLAGAANASSGEVTDMALSLQQAGSVFAAAHVPIQTVVTLISEMAQNGIKGSDAGTSLKTMMLALQTPTQQQATLMKELNLHLYDSHGAMRDFRDIIADTQGPLSKLTQAQRDNALGIIFGSDAVRAGNIILGGGVAAYDAMEKAVTRQGSAAEVAAAKSKGLGGALRGIQSEMETLGLQIFQQVSPGLEVVARKFAEILPQAVSIGSKAIGGFVSDTTKQLDTLVRTTGLKDLASDLQMIWGETHPSGAGGSLRGADLAGDRVAPGPAVSPFPKTDDQAAGSLFAQRIGDSFASAVPKILDAARKSFGGVDWFAQGMEVGKQAIPFIVGFFATMLDPETIWKSIQAHPGDWAAGLVGLLAIALAPAKLLGPIAKVLGKIPFLGPLVEGFLEAVSRAGGPFREGISRLAAAAGKALGDTTKELFPEIFNFFGRQLPGLFDKLSGVWEAGLRELEAQIYVHVGRLSQTFLGKVREMFDLLVIGVRLGVESVWTNIRILWEAMGGENLPAFLQQFVVFGEEILAALQHAGSAAMNGLRDALSGGWGAVSGWLGGVAGRAAGAVGDLSRTLWNAGASIMQGFLDGLKSKWGDITSFVGSVSDWIASHKGPLDYDRQLLIPHGHAVMAGFNEGILRGWSGVQGTIGGITGGLGGAAMAGAGASGRSGGAVHVTQHFHGSTADHRQMFADAAWEARRLR